MSKHLCYYFMWAYNRFFLNELTFSFDPSAVESRAEEYLLENGLDLLHGDWVVGDLMHLMNKNKIDTKLIVAEYSHATEESKNYFIKLEKYLKGEL